MPKAQLSPTLYGIVAAARLLKVGEGELRRLCHREEIAFYRDSANRHLFTPAHLEQFQQRERA